MPTCTCQVRIWLIFLRFHGYVLYLKNGCDLRFLWADMFSDNVFKLNTQITCNFNYYVSDSSHVMKLFTISRSGESVFHGHILPWHFSSWHTIIHVWLLIRVLNIRVVTCKYIFVFLISWLWWVSLGPYILFLNFHFNCNESGRFGAVKSDSIHHFFGNVCTKSGPFRFSQFSGCWLILSVYLLMSFAFPFGRLLGVR